MNKYRNRKVELDGNIFDSKKEAERYKVLKEMEDKGEIKYLQLQPTFVLQESFTHPQWGKQRSITYKADFEYMMMNGDIIVEDVKGVKTEVYKIKKKLFLRTHPSVTFKEV